MWCLCACPRKSNIKSNNDDNINSLSNLSGGTNPEYNVTSRRRSSSGYVQLIHDDQNPDLNLIPDHDDDPNDDDDDNDDDEFLTQRKRKVLFNLRPMLTKKKDVQSLKQKDLIESNMGIEENVLLQQNCSQQMSDLEMGQSLIDEITNYDKTNNNNTNAAWNNLVDHSFQVKYPRRHSMSACTKIAQSEPHKPMGFIMPKLARIRESLKALSGDNYKSKAASTDLSKNEMIHQERQINNCCDNEVAWKELAKETLQEFEWCLSHLSSMDSRYADSTASLEKFKLVMDREFSKLTQHQNSLTNLKHSVGPSNQSQLAPLSFIESLSISSLNNNNNNNGQSQQDNKPPNKPPPDLIGSTQIKSTNQEELSGYYQYILPNMDIDMYTELGVPLVEFCHIDQMLDLYLELWGFQIFEFDERTNHHPLVFMAMKIFTKRNLFSTFSIDPRVVYRFFLAVEAEYDSSIPYHNVIHAADVTQSIHVLLNGDGVNDVFSDLEILAVVFACAIHDIQHPGVTNQYLINIGHELAVMYNDISVLENHHLAVTFRLLQKDGCDVFSSLTKAQRQQIRKIIIELVLATDMSKHMNLLTDLKLMAESTSLTTTSTHSLNTKESNTTMTSSSTNDTTPSDSNASKKPSTSAEHTTVAKIKDSDKVDADDDKDGNKTVGPTISPALGYEKRLRILQNMVHCADLSNPTKPLAIYQEWTARIMEEFFRQGDRERDKGMDISPMCDRITASIEKSQVSFIDFIVAPLWTAWTQLVYPSMHEITDILSTNREWYQQQLIYNTNNKQNTSNNNSNNTMVTNSNIHGNNNSNNSNNNNGTKFKILPHHHHHHQQRYYYNRHHHHHNIIHHHHHKSKRHYSIEEESELENVIQQIGSNVSLTESINSYGN